ncbi:MAG TPA: MFS transporter, partial [Chloroflexota bacterium]|nr:MFS transporter [Chloroflexota bacterium]
MNEPLTHPLPPAAEPGRTDLPRELPAAVLAIAAAVILIALIYIGSRELRDFDAALIGYAVATVFAVAAVTYRYVLLLGRPPTWRYFRAGWLNFL